MSDQPTLTSIPQAHNWLIDQGYDITERTVRNHVAGGMLPATRSRGGKVQEIRILDLENYAKNHLERATGEEEDARTRNIRLQGDARELDLAIKRGQFIDKDEEEQRDAAILSGLRRHLETSAPDRLQAILAEISKLVDDEALRSLIVARQPEWLQRDMDTLADIFDQFEGA